MQHTITRLALVAAVMFAAVADAAKPPVRRPDLDVTHISRTPRYKRYVIDESRGLPQQLAPGTENDKRWPEAGEIVTYTAHVINRGEAAANPFRYQWTVDGVAVRALAMPKRLEAGERTTVSLQIPWTDEPQEVEFTADPANKVIETVETNNSLTAGSHDLTISFSVEQGIYDLYNARTNLTGSRSFEDWMQAQVAWMNERFGQALYPSSPGGIVDRVRVDKVVIVPELDGPNSPRRVDPDFLLIDGGWPVSDGDPTNAAGEGGSWLESVNLNIGRIDHGLIHELAHQLGVIDLYRMNIKPDGPDDPNGGVSVKDSSGRVITYDRLPFPVFCCGGMMGGGDTRPWNDGTFFESHTAAGMNSHARHRRGHFGEYLFDTPLENRLRIIDNRTGDPVAGARVALYQKDYNTEDIDDAPEITGTTNALGLMDLPNRPVVPIATATGHTLRPNPFGQINNVGVNGTMLVLVTKEPLEGLAFLRLHDLNLAFHDLTRARPAMYELRVDFQPITAPPANLPPVLAPIGPRTVAEGETVSFPVEAHDPGGEAIAVSAPRIPPDASFAGDTFTWTPGFTQGGFHSVTFVVTDAAGLVDSETILISVTHTNAAPVAQVGPDQVAGPNAIVTLDGTDSSDPDRDLLTYLWTQTEGPHVTLSDATSPTPTFVAPAAGGVTLRFALTLSDGVKESLPVTLTVTIHPTLTLSGNAQAGGYYAPVTWRQACSGSNRMLIVTTAEWRAGDESQVSAIAYGGVPLQKLGHLYHPETGPLATMWYLINPPAGLHEVTASLGDSFASFGSSCWYGVAQTPPAGIATAFGTSDAPSVTVSTLAGSMVVDAIASYPLDTLTADPGQALLVHVESSQSRAGHSARPGEGSSTTMSWTNPSPEQRWAMVAAVLQRLQ
ncbi:MAG TPA: CARDB domain-containing protein [Thermoanaerobaculia bacterium]|nr:CARDB domain-containing protein [Thermoanaerobaculia bacterium]